MATETFNASRYTVREQRQSRIDPEVYHTVDVALICPRCKKHLPLLEHGRNQTCDCGQYMERWGNALDCRV